MNEQTTLPARERTKPASGLAPFNRLRSEIDRLFDDFHFPAAPRNLLALVGEQRLMPAMELSAADGGYRLSVELPGMEADDIDVEFADGVLTISGEKRQESEKKEEGFLLSERRYGSFRRQITLPADVDPETIEANVKKGVLQVAMKQDKEATSRSRKIKIG
jgi:HSP20 family protein